MRNSIKTAIGDSLQDLLNMGAKTSFTEKELKELGVKIPKVKMSAEQIIAIRHKMKLSQSVFSKVLNTSVSSIRQWEQGTRKPSGSTKVLLELLERTPNLLDYRINKEIH